MRDRTGITRRRNQGQGERKGGWLSPEKKLQIFLESQGGDKHVGEILRREGLYSSDLTRIRQQVKDGALQRLATRPGVKPKVISAEAYEVLKRESIITD